MKTYGMHNKTKFLLILFIMVICVSFGFSSIKLEVIASNANIKTKPEIGGENIAKLNVGTILTGEEKQGEWYKVKFEKDGQEVTGFIHEMLVKVTEEEATPSSAADTPSVKQLSQAEIIAGIELNTESSKKLIRQEKQINEAIDSLRPLIPKVFRVTDLDKQKKLATEIYLWIGLGYAAQDNLFQALKEIKNMFEVDHTNALEISRNIYDPDIVKIIDLAEKEYLGLIEAYYLKIKTDPPDALIKLNGNEVGRTPNIVQSDSPKFSIQIQKRGYRDIKEDFFLASESSEKEYILEKQGRALNISSVPQGGKIHFNDEFTGKETNSNFPFVEFGTHSLKITKKGYEDWIQDIEISEGQGPLEYNVTLIAQEYMKIDQWGGPNTQVFKTPTGITLDQQGNIFVIDESNLKIKKFNSEGTLTRDLEDNKKDLNKLKSPFGIAVDNEGYLYVTDIKKHCVMKFDPDGHFVLKWGKEGAGDDEFNTPLGVAVDSQNNIWVADSGNHQIKKFDRLGVFIQSYGKRGISDGDFAYPAGVFITSQDEVFVTDQDNLQSFTRDGEFIASWGEQGTAPGQFDRPMGVFLDKQDCIYISDTYNSRIQKFDKNGRFITEWGSQETGDSPLNFPVGVAVDSNGSIYIAERDSDQVVILGIGSD
ncbi:MAG: PEGA domain-containing protein [Candidatus Aminicenantes bacterium]|nr:PEGA domain-containing protein [Candidatus Aminicenantes bacterium]